MATARPASPRRGPRRHEVAPAATARSATAARGPFDVRARARRLLPRPRPRRARRRATGACGSSAATGRNVLTFRDGDHLDPPADGPARRGPRRTCASRGHRPGRLADHPRHQPARLRLRVQPGQLLPLPRRPASCAVVIVEVHNTHGERHLYTLADPRDGAAERASRPRWTRTSTSRRSSTWTAATRSASGTSPAGLRIAIDEDQGDEPLLHTSLVLRRASR